TNLADDGAHVELGKNHDRVNVGQRGNDLGAFILRHDRPAFTFKRVHRFIGIDGDHELATQRPGSPQVAYVANVQKIEAAVGQRDVLAGTPPFLHALAEFAARQDFVVRTL